MFEACVVGEINWKTPRSGKSVPTGSESASRVLVAALPASAGVVSWAREGREKARRARTGMVDESILNRCFGRVMKRLKSCLKRVAV